LGNDLLFEILKLVLVFSLTFAQVGTALGEEIGDDICQWLEKRALENRHKKGWVAIEDSKERNSEGGQNTQLYNTHPCTEPHTLADICSHTEAHSQVHSLTETHLFTEDPCPQDHHQPYSDYQDEELQHPKSTRNPPEIMAGTGATPGSLTSSIDSVQPVTTTPTMFYMPMPRPGSYGSPLFSGSNISEFFRRYKQDCKDYHVSEADRLEEALCPTWSSALFEKIGLDIVQMLPCKGKNYLVVAREDLSSWVEARALSNANSVSVAKFL
jgi:hypothetical protein